jgi:hypothetical protein
MGKNSTCTGVLYISMTYVPFRACFEREKACTSCANYFFQPSFKKFLDTPDMGLSKRVE